MRLGVPEFERLFGIARGILPPECLALIDRYDFTYRELTSEERDAVLSETIRRIDAGEFSRAGPTGLQRWERGWAENLDRLRLGGDALGLMPAYIRPGQPLRLWGRYVMPKEPLFEAHWYEVFQEWLFRTYFVTAPVVYEFGSGSGINLAKLAAIFPDKRYMGLDWSAAAVEIANELGRKRGWRMEGRHFNFFAPDEGLTIEDGAVVFTLGALEQTGSWWEPFLDWLLRFRPALCVHVEPIVEWYDEERTMDYFAVRFHRARDYWGGFPARLHQLAQEGRVEVVKRKRSDFGSLYLEGYSQIVWRPL